MRSYHKNQVLAQRYKISIFLLIVSALTLTTIWVISAQGPYPGFDVQNDALENPPLVSSATCIKDVYVSRQTQNRVPDYSFEENDVPGPVWIEVVETGETSPCSFERVNTQQFHGDYSARIFGPGNNIGKCGLRTNSTMIPVFPDRHYDFSCKVQTLLGQGEADIQLRYFREGGKPDKTCETSPVSDTQGNWVELTGSMVAPPDATYAQLRVRLSDSSQGFAWFDDCFIGESIDLRIDKVDSPEIVQPGGLLTYTITYSNAGREDAMSVQVVEEYDDADDVKFGSAVPTPNASNNIWDIPSLSAGELGTITVVVTVSESTDKHLLENVVHIRGIEPVMSVRQTDIETTTVSNTPQSCQVSIAPSNTSQNGKLGDEVLHSYLVTNVGSRDGTVTVDPSSSEGFTTSVAPSSIFTLSEGGTKPITIGVTVPDFPTPVISGTVDLTAITATLECDNETSSETAVASTMVTHSKPVVIRPISNTLIITTPPFISGDSVTFFDAIINMGNLPYMVTLSIAKDPNNPPPEVEPQNPFPLDVGGTQLIIITVPEVSANTDITVTAWADDSGVAQLAHKIRFSYLPVILKPEPQAHLYVESINTGGVKVKIRDPNNNDALLLSCTISNNVTEFCGSFAPVGTYKFIALPNNCPPAEETFDDALPGVIITRSVSCLSSNRASTE
jgi:hypothetical protein